MFHPGLNGFSFCAHRLKYCGHIRSFPTTEAMDSCFAINTNMLFLGRGNSAIIIRQSWIRIPIVIIRRSYLCDMILCTGKMASEYWIIFQVVSDWVRSIKMKKIKHTFTRKKSACKALSHCGLRSVLYRYFDTGVILLFLCHNHVSSVHFDSHFVHHKNFAPYSARHLDQGWFI